MNKYVDILSKSEEYSRLIFDEEWEGSVEVRVDIPFPYHCLNSTRMIRYSSVNTKKRLQMLEEKQKNELWLNRERKSVRKERQKRGWNVKKGSALNGIGRNLSRPEVVLEVLGAPEHRLEA